MAVWRWWVEVMAESSQPAVSSARKSSQALLGALARMSLDAISKAIAKDDSTASRVRSGEARLTVGELCDLIEAADLKLVSRDRICVDRKKYEALATIAAAAMSDEASVKKLVWEGEQ